MTKQRRIGTPENKLGSGLPGQIRPFVDGQIAAIVAVHGLVLVSRNLSDFQLFAGLTVENWFN